MTLRERIATALRGEMPDRILEQAAPGGGFVLGITKNVPASIRYQSIPAIVEGLAERGHCPLEPYLGH